MMTFNSNEPGKGTEKEYREQILEDLGQALELALHFMNELDCRFARWEVSGPDYIDVLAMEAGAKQLMIAAGCAQMKIQEIKAVVKEDESRD